MLLIIETYSSHTKPLEVRHTKALAFNCYPKLINSLQHCDAGIIHGRRIIGYFIS